MRRHALPAILLVLAVGLGAAAARPGAGIPAVAGERPDGPRGLGGPVLSVRRAPASLARLAGTARLAAALDDLVHDASLGASADRTCLVVRAGDATVFAWNPSTPLAPASTLKLTLATAALEVLGPDRRFVTEVRAAGGPGPDGVLRGDLWLVGGGDPLLATDDYVAAFTRQPQVRTRFEDLADRIVAAGVRAIEGRILGDESRYDRQRHVPTWKPIYLSDFEAAPLSALVVNDGATAWAPRSPLDILSMTDAPAVHAASVLVALLQQRGVTVTGGAAAGPPPPAAGVAVAAVESVPMADVVGQLLRESDNTTAELLVKEIGRETDNGPTTVGGLAAVRAALATAGLPVDPLHAVDGSGLDVGNRLTCELLVEILGRAGPDSALARGLAVAAKSGTLYRRFVGSAVAGRVRAKSGSIKGVAALAGFATGARGDVLTFAVVANGVPGSKSFALQDRLAEVLVRYPDAPTGEELGP